jgi:hypothetical protein
MAAPKKMKNRLRLSFYVDARHKEQLDRIATRLKRPWSEIAREGFDLVLAKYLRAKR